MTTRKPLIVLAACMAVFIVMPAQALTLNKKSQPESRPYTEPDRSTYQTPGSASEEAMRPAPAEQKSFFYKKKGHGEDLVLLVVPARRIPVQMAQDMMQIRDNCLVVSYNGRPQDMDPEMFFWSGSKWVKITSVDYSKPGSYKEVPSKVVIFGTRKEIPAVVIEGMSWVDDAQYIDKLDVLTMVKKYDDYFDFTVGEWNALSRRYGVTLRDNNAGKSRYGPYSRRPETYTAQPSTSSSTVSNPQHEMLRPEPLPEPEMVTEPAPVVPEKPDTTPLRPSSSISSAPISDLEPVDIGAPIK